MPNLRDIDISKIYKVYHVETEINVVTVDHAGDWLNIFYIGNGQGTGHWDRHPAAYTRKNQNKIYTMGHVDNSYNYYTDIDDIELNVWARLIIRQYRTKL